MTDASPRDRWDNGARGPCTAPTGAVMRPVTLHRYPEQADYSSMEALLGPERAGPSAAGMASGGLGRGRYAV